MAVYGVQMWVPAGDIIAEWLEANVPKERVVRWGGFGVNNGFYVKVIFKEKRDAVAFHRHWYPEASDHDVPRWGASGGDTVDMSEFKPAEDGRRCAAEALALSAYLPAGPRVAVIGSTSFWHAESEATCVELGRRLAALDGIVVLTGGVDGVGECVSRSFLDALTEEGRDARVVHVLPHGSGAREFGRTLFAGSNMRDRREILGRVAEIYVAVEGGPGTEHEAMVASRRGAPVVPLGRTGHALDLFGRREIPNFARPKLWARLVDERVSVATRAAAAVEIVAAFLETPPR
ncbi:MAG TPA: hypothetical protein VF720_05940 [Candidatus Eisenbacteria bacterium]